jgi:hypothetical protein
MGTAVLLPLVLAEFGDWCPWLAERIVRWSARRLSRLEDRIRYEEEWLASLNQVPGKLSRLAAAFGYAVTVPRMRWSLRNSVSRPGDPADIDLAYVMQIMVKHPDGGERTVAETLADEEQQRTQIDHEMAMGSRKHHHLPRWQRWLPKLVLLFDFTLLLYFSVGVTNVYWQSPLSMALAFAIELAAMVTVMVYAFLTFIGDRMRSYKSHAGTVHLDKLDGFTKTAFGIAVAVITVLAALMYLRIHSEVLDALGLKAGVTALMIPVAVAVVSAFANFLVVLIHALDGSDEVARLDKLANATRRLAH